jgi:hypothetical protein
MHHHHLIHNILNSHLFIKRQARHTAVKRQYIDRKVLL